MVQYRTLLAAFDALHRERRRPLVRRATTARTSTGPIAYFCAEFGLHESLGIYSGGLGVLAGDHCKAASDMALPFVAVGLFYRHGYFRQTIDADGHQEHAYPDYDLSRLPLAGRGRGGGPADRARGAARPHRPRRGLAGQVGRVPLLLLDTDIPENDGPTGRSRTSSTSAAGRCACTRSSCWASAACGRCVRSASQPAAWHLNEGHSAFMLVERARELVADGQVAR